MKGLSFSEPMMKAWLAGNKSVTRRLMKPQPEIIHPWAHLPSYRIEHRMLETTNGLYCKLWHRIDENPNADGEQWIKSRYLPGETVYIRELRPIAFGDGKYAVGNDGNVYDVSKALPKKRQAYLSHNGYEQINLRHKGESRPFRVNRLVCEAFYGPPLPHETETRHMDGNRRNNWPENLDWGTRQQNALDASAAGALNGDRKAQSKLSVEDINAIRGSNEKQDVLAKRYGVGQPAISKVQSHKSHTPLPPQPPRNHPEYSSRSHALIASVRPERVKEITEEDADKEGFNGDFPSNAFPDYFSGACGHLSIPECFAVIWESLHPGSWERNDWVWRIELKKVQK